MNKFGFRVGLFAALLVLQTMPAPGQTGTPAQAVVADKKLAGVGRFHQVDEHVYRGAQPTPEGLQALARMGVVTILDLRPNEERSRKEEDQVRALGMKYENVPMRGRHAPQPAEVEQALQVLQDPARWPVFVHCHAGVDRTGTVIACYRIQKQATSNAEALEEAEKLGMHRIERGMKKFILRFQPAAPAAQ